MSRPKATASPTVYVIDDDESVRTALARLLISSGIQSKTFSSAGDFLNSGVLRDGSCVITDVKMHGMSGLDLQQRLCELGARISIIFVTAHDTESVREQAKKAGAVAYFRKPVDDQALIDAIHWALSKAERSGDDKRQHH